MKTRAILYTRVSTDEQNDGYSPSDQKARLLKYCEQHDIEVVGFFHDDESGKTFNRPQWNNIMTYLKRNKNTVDVLLFIKWDRFSRNISEAYIAIKELTKYNVEPQAIEQPLNLEIPEQKLMLAIYLAAPEVDNDRRALNVFHGIRRAKKEGRWIGKCAKGYINSRDERNKPIIAPENGKNQDLIVRAFSLFATGMFPIDDLRRQMNREGLKMSRNAFWYMLRNYGYIGKIFVPAYKDEAAEWVEGQHEGIISEDVFYSVQDILEGKKRRTPLKYLTVRDEFPLRGYLLCPQCGRNLTGSASKGSTAHFFYYHCSNGCKERHRAEELNEEFSKMLNGFKISTQGNELYALTLKHVLMGNNASNQKELVSICKEIEKQNQRLKNARMLMLDGEISAEDYKAMKVKIESGLNRLVAEQNKLSKTNEDYSEQIDFSVMMLSNIDSLYRLANTDTKQKIISSIFPEKLVFEKNKYRTNRLNEIVSLLCTDNKLSDEGKKEKHTFFDVLSCKVGPPGIEPGTY
jgi:site-specific DNA recombinase